MDEESEAPGEAGVVADMEELAPAEGESWAGYAELRGLISNDSEEA